MKEWQLWMWFAIGAIVFTVLHIIDMHHPHGFQWSAALFGGVYMECLILLKRSKEK